MIKIIDTPVELSDCLFCIAGNSTKRTWTGYLGVRILSHLTRDTKRTEENVPIITKYI